MPRFYVNAEEQYPVYSLSDTRSIGLPIDIDDETLAEFRRAEAAWDEVQSKIHTLHAAARKAHYAAEAARHKRLAEANGG